MAELQNTLPSGWDCKYDKVSGRYYYINHYTRTTTWDDPRTFHKQQPLRSTNVQVESIPMQDLSNISKNSPRGARVQDSSLSLSSASNTEEAVTKISAMFPTVSDTHIRLHLKKYMKSIFPQAEETMILDILSSNDNNIQKASDVLKDMGFEKRDSAKSLLQKVSKAQVEPPKEVKPQIAPVPKIKTLVEKQEVKYELEQKYKDIAEQVIIIALESVDYDKERANQILQMMVDDNKHSEDDPRPSSSQDIETAEVVDSVGVPLSQSRQSLKSLLKTDKSEQSLKEICTFSRVIEENGTTDDISYKSSNIKSTIGANRSLVKGANQDILLEDYIKWQGPQPSLKKGPQGIAQGPNRSLLGSRGYRTCGSNAELRKGPMFGLAQGSIFSQLKGVVVGESRGK